MSCGISESKKCISWIQMEKLLKEFSEKKWNMFHVGCLCEVERN